MPELPEVEVVRRGLAPFVTGATVTGVNVIEPRSLRRHAGPPEDFVARLTGARLLAPQRRGKFLWVPFLRATEEPDGGLEAHEALLLHLGMSGQVLIDTTDGADRHTRVRIRLDSGNVIDFVDQRIFGSLALDRLVPGPVPQRAAGETKGPALETVPSQVGHIARDPLDPAFDDRVFVRRVRAKRTEVKRALLDQTLVSGIGNIYADEALWAARVHPRQPTDQLSAVAAGRVLAEARAVMERALAEGGTSFDELYVNVNGQSGYFSRSLRAYGQQGRACERCGRPIVRESFMNRGSHFCAVCQRIR